MVSGTVLLGLSYFFYRIKDPFRLSVLVCLISLMELVLFAHSHLATFNWSALKGQQSALTDIFRGIRKTSGSKAIWGIGSRRVGRGYLGL